EGVDGEAGPGGMGGVGRGGEVLRLPTGGEVADAAVYPVPDQLHPAVATPRLPGRGGGEILGFDLVRVAAQVTAGTGHMTATADQARQVRLLLERGGGDDRSRVTDPQHPGIAVDEGLLPRLRQGGTPPPGRAAPGAGEGGGAGGHVSSE